MLKPKLFDKDIYGFTHKTRKNLRFHMESGLGDFFVFLRIFCFLRIVSGKKRKAVKESFASCERRGAESFNSEQKHTNKQEAFWRSKKHRNAFLFRNSNIFQFYMCFLAAFWFSVVHLYADENQTTASASK